MKRLGPIWAVGSQKKKLVLLSISGEVELVLKVTCMLIYIGFCCTVCVGMNMV